jgi:hypothetical protein
VLDTGAWLQIRVETLLIKCKALNLKAAVVTTIPMFFRVFDLAGVGAGAASRWFVLLVVTRSSG